MAATDEDGDKLTYTWDFRFDQNIVKGTDTIERTFQTVGRKHVKVTVSDGREEVEKEWEIEVEGFVQIQQTRTTLHLQPAVPVKVVPVKVQPVKVVNVKPVKTVTVNVKPVQTIDTTVEVQPSTDQDKDHLTLRADYIEGIPPVKVHTIKTGSQAVPPHQASSL